LLEWPPYWLASGRVSLLACWQLVSTWPDKYGPSPSFVGKPSCWPLHDGNRRHDYLRWRACIEACLIEAVCLLEVTCLFEEACLFTVVYCVLARGGMLGRNSVFFDATGLFALVPLLRGVFGRNGMLIVTEATCSAWPDEVAGCLPFLWRV
jgi:hypothetical protein